MNNKTLIFDFDGTIADSYEAFANFVAAKIGKAPLSDEHLRELCGLSLVATSIALGHHWWHLPGLYYAGLKWFGSAVNQVQPIDGMIEALRYFNQNGYQLYIISSNSTQNIKTFLDKYDACTYFAKIYGNITWQDKARVLRRLIKKFNVNRKTAFYICDEVRDLKAAHRAGVSALAVTWGYNKEELLRKYNPLAVVSTPKDIINLV